MWDSSAAADMICPPPPAPSRGLTLPAADSSTVVWWLEFWGLFRGYINERERERRREGGGRERTKEGRREGKVFSFH
jgi:hypothetical protein